MMNLMPFSSWRKVIVIIFGNHGSCGPWPVEGFLFHSVWLNAVTNGDRVMHSTNESESTDHMLDITATTFSKTTIIMSAYSTLSIGYVEIQTRCLVFQSEKVVVALVQSANGFVNAHAKFNRMGKNNRIRNSNTTSSY